MAICWLVSHASYLLLITSYLLPKKAAPGTPGTVISSNKTGGLLLKALEIRIAAFAEHGNRLAVIQAQHTHEAFGIDLLIFITDGDQEGRDGCQRDKGLYIPEGTYMNRKLMHRYAPYSVQTQKFVYNRRRILGIFHYIGLLSKFQL